MGVVEISPRRRHHFHLADDINVDHDMAINA